MDSVIGYVPMDSGYMLCPDCAADEIASDDDNGSVVFPSSETDSPTHCEECGTLIRESLTTDGMLYVVDALWQYVWHTVTSGHAGSASVLDQWREEYGMDVSSADHYNSNGMETGDKLLALYDKLRARQRAKLDVILATYEGGYGRQSGTDIHGAYWTTFEHEASAESPLDDCSVCGSPVHDGWLCMDGGEVVCSAHVLTPKQAREIASAWHAGQTSGLYALASSGAVVATARYEILRALYDIDKPGSQYAFAGNRKTNGYAMRNELRAVLAYVDAKSDSPAARFIDELVKGAAYLSTPESIPANAERFAGYVLNLLRGYGIEVS